MVHDMEKLNDIRGFITYEEEKVKEPLIKTDGAGEEKKEEDIQ